MKKKFVFFLICIISFFYGTNCLSQTVGGSSTKLNRDSLLPDTGIVTTALVDTAIVPFVTKKSYQSIVTRVINENKLLNSQDEPRYLLTREKKFAGKEFIFYLLCAVVLILGILKTTYRAYFNNLFRVFFNTSLRQTQLTDQLVQAKLPSFILNIFFAITGGIYVWLLFTHYHPDSLLSGKAMLLICIAAVGALYFLKFCILKFIGWLSTMQQVINSYIFIIFLINKIAGIILVPFIILIAFGKIYSVNYTAVLSAMVVGLFFLARYMKTYGALDRKIPLSAFHFVIYILATEIIPLLILYKVTVDYLI
ncbi:MAG: DUF4271 domain-containing protein [Ginsengibacter sp.]